MLAFAYATGLRANELVQATLGALEIDRDERWLHVLGKRVPDGPGDPAATGARRARPLTRTAGPADNAAEVGGVLAPIQN